MESFPHGETEEDGEDNQGQHGPAAQQTHEVLGGEEIDDHFRHGGMLAHLFGGQIRPGGQHRRENLHQNEHDDGGDGAGDHKGDDGGAHDLTGSLAAFHIGNGAGDGGKHQGNYDAEHQVDEHLAQEGDTVAEGREEPAHQGTGYHAAQQNDQETVVFRDRFLIHKTPSFWFG